MNYLSGYYATCFDAINDKAVIDESDLLLKGEWTDLGRDGNKT